MVNVTLPAGTAAGSDISFMNRDTKVIVKGVWSGSAVNAPLPNGKYEVWNGDAVIGTTTVSSGSATVEPPAAQ
jgi:hypothetical protein